MKKDKIIFIVGPTAVGKTDVAVKLAEKIGAEIISCDSMQIYKDMDIITSKPDITARQKIPHHLIGIVPPSKEYDVSRYRGEAVKKIKEVIKKGKVPLFVGGTGLYMTMLIDGIFEEKAKNEKAREKFYRQAEKYGGGYLYKKLSKVDQEAALKIHPNDTKRVIRALEVFESTGKPISYLQKQRKGIAGDYDVKIFCLNMEKDLLYARIQKRVEKMLKQGLVGEVRKLLERKLSRTAAYAIGIKELKGYLEGNYGLEQAKQEMARNSCLYAKRQLTWFRKDKRIKWIEINEKDNPGIIANRISKMIVGDV